MAWYPALKINKIDILHTSEIVGENILGWVIFDKKTAKWYWECPNHLCSDSDGGPGQFDTFVLALESFSQFHDKKSKEYKEFSEKIRSGKTFCGVVCSHGNVGFCPLCF